MPCKQKKYHYIYRTTCLITGKFYVGMHSTDDLEDGYLGSGKVLGYSIGKHGRENHKREILETLPDRAALKLRESELVNEQLIADPLNMNLKYGGEGGWDHMNNDPAYAEWRKSRTSKLPLEARSRGGKSTGAVNISAAHAAGKIKYNTFAGRKHSEATKQKMRETIARKKTMQRVV